MSQFPTSSIPVTWGIAAAAFSISITGGLFLYPSQNRSLVFARFPRITAYLVFIDLSPLYCLADFSCEECDQIQFPLLNLVDPHGIVSRVMVLRYDVGQAGNQASLPDAAPERG